MALWGSRDSFSIAGTVTLTNASSIVVGSGTAFTANLEVGDVIISSADTKHKVTSISNSTYMTIDPAWATDTASGETITGQDAPKFLAASGATIQAIDKVYGVDATEAVAQTTQPGWVYVNSYTDAHGNSRVKREVLVASGSYTGDAEDTVFPDVVITINTQPEDSTEDTGNAVTFSVSASTLPAGVTLNYRWQANTGSSWSNLSDGVTGGGGNYANTDTATLEIDDNTGLDGYLYRVQISATGAAANSVSDAATLTEVA